MSARVIGQDLRADESLCSWGRCQATTDGHPICTEHLRKAWAIVQAELNAAQQLAAGRVHVTDEGTEG